MILNITVLSVSPYYLYMNYDTKKNCRNKVKNKFNLKKFKK